MIINLKFKTRFFEKRLMSPHDLNRLFHAQPTYQSIQ